MKAAFVGMAAGAAAAAGLFVAGMVVAGPLDPPAGPIAGTYKTLSEVEPRIPVQSLPGDSSLLHIINAPGSYYLTGDIHVPAGKSGVFIGAPGVTLDLNGFSILGGAGSETGIASQQEGVTVRNGTVRNMGWHGLHMGAKSRVENVTVANVVLHGIRCGDDSTISGCTVSHEQPSSGDGITAGARSLIADCTSSYNGNYGVAAGGESEVRSCVSSQNGRSGVLLYGFQASVIECSANYNAEHGIESNGTLVVRDCTAADNVGFGISLGAESAATGCVVSRNGTGAAGGGILAGEASVVESCSAISNAGAGIVLSDNSVLTGSTASGNFGHGVDANNGVVIERCVANDNGGDGFNVRFGGTVRGCTARSNQGDGIEISTGGRVIANTLDANGAGTIPGAGVLVTGSACRIEDNHFVNNDWGINFTATLNTAFRNSFKFNSTNVQGGAGNDVAPTSNAATATSPWANLQL